MFKSRLKKFFQDIQNKEDIFITVIMPICNGGRLIEKTIKNILKQNYQFFELLVIDYGGEDNTRQIVNDFQDIRIKYFFYPVKSRAEAYNLGIKISIGRYITFIEPGDICLSNKLESQINFLEKNINFAMIYSSYVSIDQSEKVIKEKNYTLSDSGYLYNKIAYFPFIKLSTVMIRKEVFDNVGNFDIHMGQFFEEIDMWRRIAKKYMIHGIKKDLCLLYDDDIHNSKSQNLDSFIEQLDHYSKKLVIEDVEIDLKNHKLGLRKLYSYYISIPKFKNYIEILNTKVENIDNNIFTFLTTKNINTSPLVSIVIPVYNGEKYLEEAIESAINQTYKNIEIIIINDGSTDNTESIVLKYLALDNRISYYKKENGGVATALNLAIEKMKGEYFSWLSHDDIYLPHKVARQVNEILKYPENTVIYSDYANFTNNKNVTNPITLAPFPNFRYWITCVNQLHGCTLLIPKSAFVTVGNFKDDLITTQDYDMWFRMSKTQRFIHLPEICLLFRIHNEQSSNLSFDIRHQEIDQLYKHFVSSLSYNEIIQGSKGNSVSLSYIKIAILYFNKGFKNAAKLAFKLAFKYNLKKLITILRYIDSNMPLFKQQVGTRIENGLTNFSPGHSKNLSKLELCQDLQDKFSTIYEESLFIGKESKSGAGSSLVQTEKIRLIIPKLITQFKIKSFLDAPCGDYYWMKTVNLGVEKYLGIDIVPKVIELNNQLFGNNIVSFEVVDLVKGKIPKVDLIFSRDCLVHLNYEDCVKIIKNFKTSGSQYLLTTTFSNRKNNIDLTNDLLWRTLNMQKSPFNFPKPILLINENCTEDDNLYRDKCLGLWKLSDINI